MAKLILEDAGKDRRKVLFLIRNLFYLSLVESKKLMDDVPVTLMEYVPEISWDLQHKYSALKDAGAEVKMERNISTDEAAVVTAYYRGTPIERE
jgi:ribosomal protein L7/L12